MKTKTTLELFGLLILILFLYLAYSALTAGNVPLTILLAVALSLFTLFGSLFRKLSSKG